MKKMNKRKGFTLIELVIVVAIIGILALMIIPQFGDVTTNAQVRTFESNCQTAASAYVMYQAAHNGTPPSASTDMDDYVNGGFASLTGKPTGASITYNGTEIIGAFTDAAGTAHNFKYPD